MKIKKITILLIMVLVSVFALSGCKATDVVAKVAVTSIDAMIKDIPDKVAYDDKKGGWVITGLDSKESIILSKDFSSSNPDIALEFDAEPFIKAGLDVTKLPAGQYIYDNATGKITMPFEYGNDKFDTASEESALETFKQIVKTHRSIIGYHEEGDHYMITLGNGNLFAWAKDIDTNPKDMVFVLNPEPFIKAGVDVSKIKDWAFAKMPVTDKSGKSTKVDKILKAFSLK